MSLTLICQIFLWDTLGNYKRSDWVLSWWILKVSHVSEFCKGTTRSPGWISDGWNFFRWWVWWQVSRTERCRDAIFVGTKLLIYGYNYGNPNSLHHNFILCWLAFPISPNDKGGGRESAPALLSSAPVQATLVSQFTLIQFGQCPGIALVT